MEGGLITRLWARAECSAINLRAVRAEEKWDVQAREHLNAKTGVIEFETEEQVDRLLARQQESQHNSGTATVDIPTEFIDVSYFEGDYEETARVAVQLGNGSTRSDFDLSDYEANAARNWDAFYRRNTDKFYKDRHYLLKDFEPLGYSLTESTSPIKLLEVGCGVGNAMLPLVEQFGHCSAFGLDFAAKAIELLNENAAKLGLDKRCRGWEHDITKPIGCIQDSFVDFCTMVFVLSAIAPAKMCDAVTNVVAKLRPKGMLLFRDYADGDQAQLRFSKEQRLGHNNFVRQDGTRSFFFTLEGLTWLFEEQCGLQIVQARLIKRIVFNRAKGIKMRRVFAHVICRKPDTL